VNVVQEELAERKAGLGCRDRQGENLVHPQALRAEVDQAQHGSQDGQCGNHAPLAGA
jgi:hypothetical protein